MIRCFGIPDRPMPICMTILKKTIEPTEIYNLTSLFNLSVKVESHKILPFTMPPLPNLRPRLLKLFPSSTLRQMQRCPCYERLHQKNPKILLTPTCFNCAKSQKANYRDCQYYKHIISNISASKTIAKPPTHTSTLPSLSISQTTYSISSKLRRCSLQIPQPPALHFYKQ